MSLQQKLAMLGASLRLGRTWADKLELLRLFAKHGGLMAYAGDHEFKSIGTSFAGAPRLHFRDSGPDGILIAELLARDPRYWREHRPRFLLHEDLVSRSEGHRL